MRKLESIKRLKKRLIIALAGFWVALALSAQASQSADLPIHSPIHPESPPHLAIVVQNPGTAARELGWQQNIAAGIEAFDQGRLTDAIAHWQTALSTIETPETEAPVTEAPVTEALDTRLTQAYLLSNIAAAHLQLAQLTDAQAAIAKSLDIVNRWSVQSQGYWEISARVLNTQGRILYQLGQTEQALNIWQQATAHYRNAQQPTGAIKTQINQAIALQELGLNTRAIQLLTQLSQQLSPQLGQSNHQSPNLPPVQQPYTLQIDAALALSKALRRAGELPDAQAMLERSLRLIQSDSVANRAQVRHLKAELRLELAHTLRALSHREIAIGRTQQAANFRQQALSAYSALSTEAASMLTSEIAAVVRIQAQTNQLSYLIETESLQAARTLWPQIDLSVLPPGRDRTEAHISYAHSLNCLRSPRSTTCVKQAWQTAASETKQKQSHSSSHTASASKNSTLKNEPLPDWPLIAQTLASALRQSEALADPLLIAYSTGELGHTYELAGQFDEATQLTQQALRPLEGKQIPEAAYRWEWQLGRLYSRSADSVAAIAAYQQALQSLQEARQNLLLINPQVQFSFRDDVEPVYREFVALLLNEQSNSGGQHNQLSNEDKLSQAIQAIDALQLTELENFLGCNLAQLVNLAEENTPERTDSKAAKIYPILLSDQLAEIIDIPGQPLSLRSLPISSTQVEETVSALRNNLTIPGRTPEVLTFAQQLYAWLITPVESVLANNEQIETLVFVLDGPLRNVPMGVLYDGQQYLIEKKYAIAVAPQIALFSPRPSPSPLRILRGGISLPQTVKGRRFPPIELVRAELEQIPTELVVSPPLLDEAFSQANIEQQLEQKQYSAIHWKTHGVFSADPTETFLVAYEQGITANELSTLIQSARAQQAEPIELLVLSACETAQGDRRAVLGLAGIAVRAGTRSTLSTLWRADDRANTQLMDDFYQGLQQGLTKAQALQRSQRSLLTEAGYPAPYYWAPYVLVGNWL